MKFRKKPVVIEANQYRGRNDIPGVCDLVDCGLPTHVHTIHDNQPVLIEYQDWIITEPDGIHYYPCKPDIFETIYEPAGELE